jgi:excisionase family DNA binding protein
MKLMQVREAARELGIHENTLRRWEEAGVIRAVHLPTGVRRFLPEDVERLQREMYDPQAERVLARTRLHA